jgi:ABC-type sugar transport system substrate-binding protein
VILVSILFVFLLTSPAVFATGKTEKQLTIASIMPGVNNEYYKYASDGVKLAGKVKGIRILDYSSELQAEKELANIEDAITQKVNGMILFSVSASAIDAAVVKANEAKIPKLTLTPMKVISKANLGEIVRWVSIEATVDSAWKIDYDKHLLHQFAQ